MSPISRFTSNNCIKCYGVFDLDLINQNVIYEVPSCIENMSAALDFLDNTVYFFANYAIILQLMESKELCLLQEIKMVSTNLFETLFPFINMFSFCLFINTVI